MKLTKKLLIEMIEEVISGTGLHNLVAGSSLYDIEQQENGFKRLLDAAYISGQRKESIAGLQEENPWFESFDELQDEWNRGRQWARDLTAEYTGET